MSKSFAVLQNSHENLQEKPKTLESSHIEIKSINTLIPDNEKSDKSQSLRTKGAIMIIYTDLLRCTDYNFSPSNSWSLDELQLFF